MSRPSYFRTTQRALRTHTYIYVCVSNRSRDGYEDGGGEGIKHDTSSVGRVRTITTRKFRSWSRITYERKRNVRGSSRLRCTLMNGDTRRRRCSCARFFHRAANSDLTTTTIEKRSPRMYVVTADRTHTHTCSWRNAFGRYFFFWVNISGLSRLLTNTGRTNGRETVSAIVLRLFSR